MKKIIILSCIFISLNIGYEQTSCESIQSNFEQTFTFINVIRFNSSIKIIGNTAEQVMNTLIPN
jgi:hypothetical protein